MEQHPTTVVFDLGGVLIDWNPRYLYRQLLADDDAVERFLATVTTQAWNVEQDRGRPWAEAVETLTTAFPQHADLIAAYDSRWEEMLGGPIDDTVDLLRELHQSRPPGGGDGNRPAVAGLYALTNWSAEKFEVAMDRYDFLDWFDGIVVSGREGLVKPDPRLYQVLVDRHGLDPADTLFIDDSPTNVAAAQELGMTAVRFVDPPTLRTDLAHLL